MIWWISSYYCSELSEFITQSFQLLSSGWIWLAVVWMQFLCSAILFYIVGYTCYLYLSYVQNLGNADHWLLHWMVSKFCSRLFQLEGKDATIVKHSPFSVSHWILETLGKFLILFVSLGFFPQRFRLFPHERRIFPRPPLFPPTWHFKL